MTHLKRAIPVTAIAITIALSLVTVQAEACNAFVWTRYVAVLYNGQQMAVPNANSIPNAFARAKGCSGSVASITQFSQPTAYCLDPAFQPIVCHL